MVLDLARFKFAFIIVFFSSSFPLLAGREPNAIALVLLLQSLEINAFAKFVEVDEALGWRLAARGGIGWRSGLD